MNDIIDIQVLHKKTGVGNQNDTFGNGNIRCAKQYLHKIFTNDMIISDSAAIAFMHTAMCNVGRATTYKR